MNTNHAGPEENKQNQNDDVCASSIFNRICKIGFIFRRILQKIKTWHWQLQSCTNTLMQYLNGHKMFSSCLEKPLNSIKFTIFDMFTDLIISFHGNQGQTGVDANYLRFCWDIKCNISSVPVWLFSGVCEAFRSYKYKILMRQSALVTRPKGVMIK